MLASREIKRRLNSIKNTRKITKAMELVAASKMRKAVEKVLTSRPYADEAWMLLSNIAQKVDKKLHCFLEPKEQGKSLIIIIGADKGLCGGLSANLLKSTLEYLKSIKAQEELDALTIGKKAQKIAINLKLNIIAHFENLLNKPEFSDIRPIRKIASEEFSKAKYNKILLVYTDFISVLRQKPNLRQLLPIEHQDQLLGQVNGRMPDQNQQTEQNTQYIFEPNVDELLDKILMQLLEVQLYQALLEAAASEQAARMTAMQNASQQALDMIADLTLSFNQARQAGITAELADISTAKIAME